MSRVEGEQNGTGRNRPVAAGSGPRALARGRGGFTLVETMVVLTITGIMSVALMQMVQVGQRSSERNQVLAEMQQNARVGLQQLADDIRHVSYGKDPTQPSINYAGPDSVDFVADLLSDNPGAEEVAFFLAPDGDPDTPNPDDTMLMKVVRDTAGVVLSSAPQAYGITSTGLAFRWFNGGGTELANPVPQPEQVGEILITLNVASSRPLDGTYPEMEVSTTIYPRNLPLSPARSRPNPPGCSPLTFPDCESATLTWTTPTTNTDGTTLELADISHFALYYGLDPDELWLYTKLARTINSWTINGLTGGHTYFVAVTCVSRSGVESYRCGQEADMSSPLIPEAPATLDVLAGAGAVLQWSPVTLFETGQTINTPVHYLVHRGVAPGFTPDASNRVADVAYTTTWTDTALVSCSTNYYVVRARACGNDGDPSPEVSKDHPAPPAAASGITASPGSNEGEALVQWSPFLMRNDGTSLDPADISGYKVFADTLPSPTTLRMQVPHPASSALLTGLEPCKSWYVNLLCVDACGHDGDYIPSAAVPVLLTAGCEPGNPASPPSLTLVPLDTRIQLEWPANTTDCDLSGYRIYYGTTSGVYDGVDAAEGPSPVEVASPVVTLGSVCRFELTGLPTCVPYHVAVAAYDACSPPNVSPLSPEANGTTTCIACEVADACLGWATGPSNTQVNLEVYTGSSGGETITRLTPSWSGGALLQSVWYGRPLTAIWASDGSAGEDGPVGPRPSGTELNLADVSVPSWSGEGHGEPLRLEFSADMRGVPLELSFRGTSGVCTAGGTVTEAAVFDDWNDGDYTGWTKTGGTWSVSGGQLNQTATSNSYVLYKDGFSSGSQTIEAKVKVVGGTGHSAYIVFRGTDASNYWVFGIRTDQDRVRVARIRAGAWYSELAYANLTLVDNQWYSLRVVIEGTRVRGWVDCEPVIDANSSYIPLTGKAGLSTRNANASFEDVRIYGATVLP